MTKNEIINIIFGYRNLSEGWDGYYAAKPCDDSVTDSIKFLECLNLESNDFEPTLHSDGSILLESEKYTLKFKGNGYIIFSN